VAERPANKGDAAMTPSTSLHYSAIHELSRRIREQSISPVEVVNASLRRIARLQPQLNAFIRVLADDALKQARAAADEIAAGGWRGPLHGIPVGIKDMFDTAGIPTTAAFEAFKDRVPAKDAVAVSKLKESGAVIVGKMNMHELAMGTTSVVSYFGAVHNPWNLDYIAGGSSGGSAAAVASGMCYATLDTDAIGSCRLPASCCGATAFKGTYRLISNQGVLEGEPVDEAVLWLAHAAVTTRSAADTALLLNVLAEPRSSPAVDFFAALDEGGAPRLGVATNAAASDEVKASFDAAVRCLQDLGCTLRETTAPMNPGFDVRNIEVDRQAIAESLFREIDLLVLPTTATSTPTIREAGPDPQALSPQNTFFANYYGLPAVSVPCGFDRHGLPLGLQIIGGPGEDLPVLQLAHRYQATTPGAAKRPSDESPRNR
jgi:aspartyl-tRNA(Asn)/glutamyl-tRNA(Gln) amidotransferase subunit A